jgi:hypothetical protein
MAYPLSVDLVPGDCLCPRFAHRQGGRLIDALPLELEYIARAYTKKENFLAIFVVNGMFGR